MIACRIGVISGVWVHRKVVFMCVEVGGLRKCLRKMFWGNPLRFRGNPPSISSISLWSNSVCGEY